MADPVTVGELMHMTVVSASPDMPVAEAAAMMAAERVGSACVLQGSFLVGILTERDVLRAAASGSDLTVSKTSEWMTPDPQSASPDTPADELQQLLAGNAAELYEFNLAALAPLAEQVGPTVAELSQPLTELPAEPNEALLKAAR